MRLGTKDLDAAFEKYLQIPMQEFAGGIKDATNEKIEGWRKLVTARSKRLVETVESENRSLTNEEQAAFDEGVRMIEFWTKEIAKRGEIQSFQRTHKSPNSGGLRFTDTATGREVCGLAKGERFSKNLSQTLPDGIHRGDLSLGRMVKAMVTGDWRGAENERLAMGGSSDPLGGYLLPSPLAFDVIDLVRNKSVVMEAGAVTLPMGSSELKLARVTKDATPGWKAENAAGSKSVMNFGAIKLSARTLMALATVSVELVEDAANLDTTVRNAISETLALELDRAALRGDGTGSSPIGVRNASGVTVTDLATDGYTLTDYSKFSLACDVIAGKNGVPRTVIYAPRTAGELDRLQDTLHQPLRAPESFAALQKLVTNQIPINLHHGTATTASEAYVGDFSQLLVGIRTNVTIEVSREAGDSSGGAFSNLQVWIRAYLRTDIIPMRPEMFVVMDGIL